MEHPHIRDVTDQAAPYGETDPCDFAADLITKIAFTRDQQNRIRASRGNASEGAHEKREILLGFEAAGGADDDLPRFNPKAVARQAFGSGSPREHHVVDAIEDYDHSCRIGARGDERLADVARDGNDPRIAGE